MHGSESRTSENMLLEHSPSSCETIIGMRERESTVKLEEVRFGDRRDKELNSIVLNFIEI